jgi:Tol biopolymer transport system component
VLVVLAVVAAFVVPQLGDDDSTATDGSTSPTENPTDRPTTEGPTDEPTDDGPIDIPRSAPLSDTQMLVAAGDNEGELKIWRVDVSDPTKTRQVSTGDPKEWLPVLGPNRDTMIYSREKGQRGSGNFELRVAAVNNDANEPVLDDSDTQCAEHAGRPAWSKGSEPEDWFFVLRCRAFPPEGSTAQQPFTLQLGDVQGNDTQLDVKKQGSDDNWLKMGDPTISPDGSMVVVWVTDTVEHEAGSLYGISLEDGHSFRLLDATRPRQFSDPVFSPSLEETRIAFRAIGDNGTFDIWTAVLDGEKLAAPPEELVTSADAFEEDPSFSPDGTQVVFTRRPTNQATSTLQLVDVNTKIVSGFDLPEKFPPVAKVPAWTTR